MKTQHKLELENSFGSEYFCNIFLVMRQARAELPDYVSFLEETLRKLIIYILPNDEFVIDLTHKSLCQTPYRIDNSLEFGIIESVKEN